MSVTERTARRRDSASNDSAGSSSAPSGGWARNSKLGLVCLALFLLFWAAQAVTGWKEDNDDAVTHHEPEISFGEYLTTGHFWEATTENWESEFLQMGSFVLLTIFFIQKGSPESKRPGGDDVDEDPRAQGFRSGRAVARPSRRSLAGAVRELAVDRVLRDVPRRDRRSTR